LEQFDTFYRTDFAAVVGDQIRCGAAEDESSVCEPAQSLGGGTGVVPRLGIDLFVAPFVLFIEHHEAKIWHRREYGAPGANDEAGISALNAEPLVVEFARGELGVKHGECLGESLAVAANCLGS
jgi:hypothetical protein